LLEDKGRLFVAQGKITNQNSEVVAEGEGKFIKAEGEMAKLLT
jgi:hypothetical protein